ncbi:MAG TPA: hypothetical protein VEH30_05980 [Terriglobales bacterium]|nr:hypothetical protein [Terriglobales bacterium]
MKKLPLLAITGVVLLGSLSLAAQDAANLQKTSPRQHAKAIRISGKVSDDGARFVDTDQRVWLVTNPEMLKGYEGKQAAVRAQRGVDSNTIQVLSIKRPVSCTANWSDSAFRR